MINEQKDNLFKLIKSLTKSEKRQFKLYVGRMGSNNNAKFLSLFNFLDKLDKYNEKAIEIMKKHDVKVNDLYNHILPHLKKLQRPVNVHVSPEGSLYLARKVAKDILEKLPKK